MRKFLLVASLALLGSALEAQAVKESHAVGIETDKPRATLDVNGDVRVQQTEQAKIPSNEECPCFLVVDKNGVIKRVPVSQGSGSGSGTGGSTGGGTTVIGGGVSPVDGGVSNPDVLTPQSVYDIGWSTYRDYKTIDLNVNLPDGVPYSAYMSPEIVLPTVDGGTRNVRITYPKGTTERGVITATILVDGDHVYAPKLIFDKSEEKNYEIPLYFNGVEQKAKLVFRTPVNAVRNTEHGKAFLYPVVKLGDKYLTQMNLGAKYAELAGSNPTVLKEWISNPDWEKDYKAYGSLFQWQRKADGHELINWTSSTSGIRVNGFTKQKASSWTNAGTDKFIDVDENRVRGDFDRSWVEGRANREGPFNLWQSGGANNPCPQGYHVFTTEEEGNVGISYLYNNRNNRNEIFRLVYSGYPKSSPSGAGTSGYYWTSSNYGEYFADYYYKYGSRQISNGEKVYRYDGMSIRCIKD